MGFNILAGILTTSCCKVGILVAGDQVGRQCHWERKLADTKCLLDTHSDQTVAPLETDGTCYHLQCTRCLEGLYKAALHCQICS